jgi:hypothetical protein
MPVTFAKLKRTDFFGFGIVEGVLGKKPGILVVGICGVEGVALPTLKDRT